MHYCKSTPIQQIKSDQLIRFEIFLETTDHILISKLNIRSVIIDDRK